MIKMNKKILIIEDEIVLRNVLQTKLSQEGFEIFIAGNGKEGLKIALHKHPDLILLDIAMPVMDGITMLKKIKTESEWGGNAKIILLTNLSDSEKVAEALLYGFQSYLVKVDWTANDVVKKVKEELGIV